MHYANQMCRGLVVGCWLMVALAQQRLAAAVTPAPHQPSPAPGVTCYTCVNVSDNLICNQYAIDRPCPHGDEFCHTLHVMDSHGESVVVNKKCANGTECTPQRVGCVVIDAQRVCVSCCDEMYCNEAVPTNHSTAVFSNTRTRSAEKAVEKNVSNRCSVCGLPFCDFIMVALMLYHSL
ncbi:ly6/PLAUR domain-containing protein 6B-like [Schistocerca serialis cubense]|uniref:ly6/PLAUR domain-containing protein 6B-like n=1 Tax=Schistocerca serialis cubense TaxID=2023355 RepID=UPI00214E5848|nr:ly6/PLAUR domain-containing protein 6B-like [Schistocerca serialis cubense]